MTDTRPENPFAAKLRNHFRIPDSLVRIFSTDFRSQATHLHSQRLGGQIYPEASMSRERQTYHAKHLLRYQINGWSLNTFSFLSDHVLETLVSNTSLYACSEFTVRKETSSKLKPNICTDKQKYTTIQGGGGLRRGCEDSQQKP